MSAFLGPDQSATESLLASDPEVLPWVQKYQRSRETVSQTDYEVRVTLTFHPKPHTPHPQHPTNPNGANTSVICKGN